MCTLTYIPQSDNGFIVTSNRDETPFKPALHPSRKYVYPRWITYPTDIAGGGSWIAATDDGTIAILLNGAFTAHKRTPPYGHSRGKIVLLNFGFKSLQALSEKYILDNIEPFTLVRIKPGKDIEELRWDGNTAHCTLLPLINHVSGRRHRCTTSLCNKNAMHGLLHCSIKYTTPNRKICGIFT